jgi:thiamine biosynthesis lipoprotein
MSTYRPKTRRSPGSTASRSPRSRCKVSAELYGHRREAPSSCPSLSQACTFDITFDSVGRLYDYRRRRPAARRRSHPPRASRTSTTATWCSTRRPRTHPLRHAEGTRINLGGIAKGYSVRARRSRSCASGRRGSMRWVNCRRGDTPLHRRPARQRRGSSGSAIRTMPDKVGHAPRARSTRRSPRPATTSAISSTRTASSLSTTSSIPRTGDSAQRRPQRDHHRTRRNDDRRPRQRPSSSKGPEKGLAIVASVPGYEAVVVDDQRRVRYSKGLASGSGRR